MIRGPGGAPVLLTSARSPSSVYVIAIDLETKSALWKHKISENVVTDLGAGQWPIAARSDTERAVVFPTARNGVPAVVGP